MRHLLLLLVIVACLVLGGGMAAIAAPTPPCQFWEVCSIVAQPVDVGAPIPLVIVVVLLLAAFTALVLRFTRKDK